MKKINFEKISCFYVIVMFIIIGLYGIGIIDLLVTFIIMFISFNIEAVFNDNLMGKNNSINKKRYGNLELVKKLSELDNYLNTIKDKNNYSNQLQYDISRLNRLLVKNNTNNGISPLFREQAVSILSNYSEDWISVINVILNKDFTKNFITNAKFSSTREKFIISINNCLKDLKSLEKTLKKSAKDLKNLEIEKEIESQLKIK